MSDREAFAAVIADECNRYLVRHLCWLFVIDQLEAYILHPRDPADFALLRDAYRASPSEEDVDVLIGVRGPIASPEMCNGLALPIVVLAQLYSFTRTSLIDSIPHTDSATEKEDARFRQTATELFTNVRQVADNAGATDEHRALNYLGVRYPTIHTPGPQGRPGGVRREASQCGTQSTTPPRFARPDISPRLRRGAGAGRAISPALAKTAAQPRIAATANRRPAPRLSAGTPHPPPRTPELQASQAARIRAAQVRNGVTGALSTPLGGARSRAQARRRFRRRSRLLLSAPSLAPPRPAGLPVCLRASGWLAHHSPGVRRQDGRRHPPQD